MDVGFGISTFYPVYNPYPVEPVNGLPGVTRGAEDTSALGGVNKAECQTCKERKYIDGSNDNSVSFQTPTHISPNAAGAAVMGHEKEHVAAAVAEGKEEGKELVSASVSIHTSVCPECGRVYVSGGETRTTIRTSSGEKPNPYDKMKDAVIGLLGAGSYVDQYA